MFSNSPDDEEGIVKRSPHWPWWLLFIVALALALSACERPLQENAPTVPAANQTPLPGLTPGGGQLPLPGQTPGGQVPLPGVTPLGTATVDPLAPLPTATTGAELATAAPTVEVAATPRTEEVTYVVVTGDTLGNIATRYGVSVDEIAARNGLANIHSLDVGQQLIIPVPGSTTTTGGTGVETVHIVQAGETLFRIGQLYGVSFEELAAYNNLANPDDIDVGQAIRIPPR
jgi:LysM repeat protein